MQNQNYINIQGWMINNLELKGNELILYAIIYGFSQDGITKYRGSIWYIMDALKLSNKGVINILKRLEKKKLIKKTKSNTGNLYEAVNKVHSGCEQSSQVSREQSSHNNNKINNNNNAGASSEEEFNQSEYLEEMINSKQKHITIIGGYLKYINFSLPTKAVAQLTVKRWLKDAKFIADYSEEKRNKAIQYVEEKYPKEWNLSTVAKYIGLG